MSIRKITSFSYSSGNFREPIEILDIVVEVSSGLRHFSNIDSDLLTHVHEDIRNLTSYVLIDLQKLSQWYASLHLEVPTGR